jgi:hypothetical protein
MSDLVFELAGLFREPSGSHACSETGKEQTSKLNVTNTIVEHLVREVRPVIEVSFRELEALTPSL